MNEFEKVKAAIKSRYHVDEEAWANLESLLEIKKYRKGEMLVKDATVVDNIYFLVSGISRNFFVRNDKEFTIDFHFEGDFVTGFYSLITNQPSPICVEVLMDASVVVIPVSPIKQLYASSVRAANFGRVMAEMHYIKRLRKEMDLMSLTAEERYANMLSQQPDLVKIISVKHLSSYLGIQPESLSRIRKKHEKS